MKNAMSKYLRWIDPSSNNSEGISFALSTEGVIYTNYYSVNADRWKKRYIASFERERQVTSEGIILDAINMSEFISIIRKLDKLRIWYAISGLNVLAEQQNIKYSESYSIYGTHVYNIEMILDYGVELKYAYRSITTARAILDIQTSKTRHELKKLMFKEGLTVSRYVNYVDLTEIKSEKYSILDINGYKIAARCLRAKGKFALGMEEVADIMINDPNFLDISLTEHSLYIAQKSKRNTENEVVSRTYGYILKKYPELKLYSYDDSMSISLKFIAQSSLVTPKMCEDIYNKVRSIQKENNVFIYMAVSTSGEDLNNVPDIDDVINKHPRTIMLN